MNENQITNEEKIWFHVMTDVDLMPVNKFFQNWRDQRFEKIGADVKEAFDRLYEMRGLYFKQKQMTPGTHEHEDIEKQIEIKRRELNILQFGEHVCEKYITDKGKEETKLRKIRKGRLEHTLKYYDAGTRQHFRESDGEQAELNFAMKMLDNDLWEQWFTRRDEAVIKILDITGDFDNMSDLKLNDKGELNGTVTGVCGTATVKTVTVAGTDKKAGYRRLLISKA